MAHPPLPDQDDLCLRIFPSDSTHAASSEGGGGGGNVQNSPNKNLYLRVWDLPSTPSTNRETKEDIRAAEGTSDEKHQETEMVGEHARSCMREAWQNPSYLGVAHFTGEPSTTISALSFLFPEL